MTALLLLMLQVTPELRQHVDAGLKAKAAGDLDSAIREFTVVAKLAPSLPAAHVNLGAVYLQKKNYSEAVGPLRKALELNPDLPGAHGMLGTALLAQGWAAESIPHLEKGQAVDLLGVALLEAGRAREAIDQLESALLKQPGDEDLTYYLSRAHERLAQQLQLKLRAANPESARAQQLMGEAMAATGNREAGEKHLRAALAARPELRGVHLALGELFLESGDYERAEPEFRAETALAPGSAVAAYKLGLVLQNRGATAEALQQLRRADELQPGMPETQLELGKALAAAGDGQGATTILTQLLEREKESKLAESAHYQLWRIYGKLGRTAEAERHQRMFEQLRKR